MVNNSKLSFQIVESEMSEHYCLQSMLNKFLLSLRGSFAAEAISYLSDILRFEIASPQKSGIRNDNFGLFNTLYKSGQLLVTLPKIVVCK